MGYGAGQKKSLCLTTQCCSVGYGRGATPTASGQFRSYAVIRSYNATDLPRVTFAAEPINMQGPDSIPTLVLHGGNWQFVWRSTAHR